MGTQVDLAVVYALRRCLTAISSLYTQHQQHEHIRAASCRSRSESQWESPKLDPQWAKTIGRIKVKIGSFNHLGCLTKRVKFQIFNPSGVVWPMG